MPSVIKTEVPLDCDDLARKDLLLQQYGERIEKLSQQDRLSGQGDGVPKACPCGGLARVPNLRVCNTFSLGSGTRRGGRMN